MYIRVRDILTECMYKALLDGKKVQQKSFKLRHQARSSLGAMRVVHVRIYCTNLFLNAFNLINFDKCKNKTNFALSSFLCLYTKRI